MVNLDAEMTHYMAMNAQLDQFCEQLRADGCSYVDELRTLVNRRAALAVRLGIAAVLQEMHEMELAGESEH